MQKGGAGHAEILGVAGGAAGAEGPGAAGASAALRLAGGYLLRRPGGTAPGRGRAPGPGEAGAEPGPLHSGPHSGRVPEAWTAHPDPPGRGVSPAFAQHFRSAPGAVRQGPHARPGRGGGNRRGGHPELHALRLRQRGASEPGTSRLRRGGGDGTGPGRGRRRRPGSPPGGGNGGGRNGQRPGRLLPL